LEFTSGSTASLCERSGVSIVHCRKTSNLKLKVRNRQSPSLTAGAQLVPSTGQLTRYNRGHTFSTTTNPALPTSPTVVQSRHFGEDSYSGERLPLNLPYHSLPWLQKSTTAAGDHNLLLPPSQVLGRVQWFHRPPVREVRRVHVARLRLGESSTQLEQIPSPASQSTAVQLVPRQDDERLYTTNRGVVETFV